MKDSGYDVFKATVLSRLEDLERAAAIHKLNMETLRKDARISRALLMEVAKRTENILARFN